MTSVFMMRVRYVGWPCALGIHRGWFVPANATAHFTKVRHCVRCGDPESARLVRLVARERSLWRSVPREMTADEQEAWVRERLYDRAAAMR